MTTDGSEEGVKERVTLPEEGCLLREVEQRSVSVEMVMVYFQQQSVSAVGSRAPSKSGITDIRLTLEASWHHNPDCASMKAKSVAVGKVTSG